MTWVPVFETGLWNAWWFMSVFILQMIVVALTSKETLKRTDRPPDMKLDKPARILGIALTAMFIVAILYSVFLPFYLGTVWFYTGLTFFLLGLLVLVVATINFARTPLNEVIVRGLYHYSRHPAYMSMFLVYIGVSLATASWLFFLITIISIILQRQEAMLEENYCLEKYGSAYREYMKMTPRWIGPVKSG